MGSKINSKSNVWRLRKTIPQQILICSFNELRGKRANDLVMSLKTGGLLSSQQMDTCLWQEKHENKQPKRLKIKKLMKSFKYQSWTSLSHLWVKRSLASTSEGIRRTDGNYIAGKKNYRLVGWKKENSNQLWVKSTRSNDQNRKNPHNAGIFLTWLKAVRTLAYLSTRISFLLTHRKEEPRDKEMVK